MTKLFITTKLPHYPNDSFFIKSTIMSRKKLFKIRLWLWLHYWVSQQVPGLCRRTFWSLINYLFPDVMVRKAEENIQTLSFMLFVMLSVSFVVRCLYVQFFMTLRPSTKFQLSHSCHNTIFDRIGSLSLPHPLEKERESQRFKASAVYIHCISW